MPASRLGALPDEALLQETISSCCRLWVRPAVRPVSSERSHALGSDGFSYRWSVPSLDFVWRFGVAGLHEFPQPVHLCGFRVGVRHTFSQLAERFLLTRDFYGITESCPGPQESYAIRYFSGYGCGWR